MALHKLREKLLSLQKKRLKLLSQLSDLSLDISSMKILLKEAERSVVRKRKLTPV